MANLDLSFIIKLSCFSTLIFFGLVASQDSTEESYRGQSDLVKSLPGYTGNYSERGHYSGYLKADDRTFLHYWFFQSRTGNWRTDPVLVWINGGPGGTSVGMGVSRFGALALHEDGSLKLEHNHTKYAWVERANVLYFDTPAGVGFSYQLNPKDKDIKDYSTADYNLAAIKDFFFKFPLLQNNSFYLTGESYGSIYISLLGVRLVKEKFPPNFKGILYTSAFFYGSMANSATAALGYQLGVFDQSHWARFLESCCPVTFCSVRECFFRNIDKGNCYFQIQSACCDAFLKLEDHNIHNIDKFDGILQERIPGGPIWPQDWFRNDSVMEALNINRNYSTPKWKSFNWRVRNTLYKAHSVLEEVRTLLENGIRMVLCYGDSDLNTSYFNGIWLLDYLADQLTTVQPHTPWFFEDQMAGYQRRLVYTNRDNTTNTKVTLVVVRHAGHDVKVDQTKRYFKIVDDFFAGV